MRAFRHVLLTVTALVAALLLTAVFLASRPDGFAWLAAQAPQYVPGELEITQPSGDLLSGVAAAQVRYRADAFEVIATRPALVLNLPAALTGILRINELTIEQLDIKLLESADSKAPSDSPPEVNLPLPLEIVTSRINLLNVIRADATDRIENVVFDGAMRGARLRADALALSSGNIALAARGKVRFSDDWPLEVSVDWSLSTERPVTGQGALAGDLKRLKVSQTLRVPEAVKLEAILKDIWSALSFTATVETTTGEALNFNELMLSDTRAQLVGNLAAINFESTGVLQTPQLPAEVVRFATTGTATPQRVRIDALDATLLDGNIGLSGTLELQDLEINAMVDAAGLRLNTIDPQLPDAVSATANLTGKLPDQLNISFKELRGRVNNQDVIGNGNVTWRSETLAVDAFTLFAADNRTTLDGSLWPALDATFAVDLPNPALFLADASGRLQASGRIGGSAAAPELDISATGSQLKWLDRSIETFAINATIAETGLIDVTANGQQVRVSTQSADDISLSVQGTLNDFQLNAALASAELNIKMSGTGDYRADRIRLRLDNASVDSSQLGDWQLANQLTLESNLTAGSLQFSAHCWRNSPAELCAEAGNVGTELAIAAELRDLPVQGLMDFAATTGTVVAGAIDAQLNITGTQIQPVASGAVAVRNLTISAVDPDEPDEQIRFAVNSAGANLSLEDQQLSLSAAARADGELDISIEGKSDWPLNNAASISGAIRARIATLENLEALLYRYTNATNPTGAFMAAIDISGTLGRPIVAGSAQITDGGISVPQAGIDVTEIDIRLAGNGTEPLILTATGRSGEGVLNLNGSVNWLGESPRAQFALQSERFQLLRFPNQVVLASPDLTLEITPQLIDIQGRIEIPEADITVEELPQSAVQPTEDVIVIREAKVQNRRANGPAIKLDVALLLGEDVRLIAFGLDTQLRGSLQLTRDADDTRILADGNLRSVDGRFEAYNRELRIERGTLVFTGPIDQPMVDVRAVRELRYEDKPVTVGVLLSGPIDKMQTRVFGEPAMSESDALSYLVLNRPLRRSESVNDDELSTAAVALGLSSLLSANEDLGNNLGLDEVGIDTTDGGDTAVVAGKRLSDDVYIRYAYGLFDRIGTFVVRYEIGKGFSLEAGSGEEQTIDLLYSIDR